MHVTRTEEQWKLLAEADSTVPIVMLNLIRFREHALDGYGCDGMTGEEAYAEYGRRLRALASDFPGTAFWVGEAKATFIGPEDETWDLVLLVGYDSVSIFREMLASEAYQAAATARTAAVLDSRLVLTHETRNVGEAMAQWASADGSESERSVVMLNLIRHRAMAMVGHTCDGMTGEEAYTEYLRRLEAMDNHDFPGTIVWTAEAKATVIGPSDERWDRVLLVAYESVDELKRMGGSEAYQTAAPARTAAVDDSRLVLMHQKLPRS